jgi:hypothetical protein
MMRQRKGLGFLSVLLAAAAAWIGMPASAATAEEVQPIAEVRITPGGVDWVPLGEDQGFTLTVAGPQGVVLYREFSAGEVPSLGLLDEGERALADGVYTYELRSLAPTDGLLRESMGAEPSRLLSGYLSVRYGGFVVPIAHPEAQVQRIETGSGESSEVVDVADFVLPEGLVVQGNACIGEECLEGDESPTSATLTLKNDVLELRFTDTPIGISPRRDWSIFINDFLGSGEHFAVADLGLDDPPTTISIPFRLVGGAPDHSLYVSSAGNVGLGTSVPGTRLHLFSAATADVFAGAGPNPASGPAFNFGYGGASFGRGAGFLNARPDASAVAPNPSLRFLTADVERMIVTNTGNVGIGTASPSAQLHVRRTNGTARLLVEEASGTLDNNRVLVELVNKGRAQVRMRNTADAAGLSWFISHESNGNFGISREGTGTLEVTITPTGNMVITGNYTPDYVFEPDYELMPLPELAEFVARERHLPNVPNAAEIKANGINVNDFPMQLLEKIEELTLYAIAQQETIDELRARLEAIEQRDAAPSEP